MRRLKTPGWRCWCVLRTALLLLLVVVMSGFVFPPPKAGGLPSFPGLDSGKQAFDYGVKFTGCTVHFVDAGVDTGAIINQKCVAIEDTDTLESMMIKLHAQEHLAYPEALKWIAEGRIQLDDRRISLK